MPRRAAPRADDPAAAEPGSALAQDGAPMYFPPQHGGTWETVDPAEAGFDPAR